MAKVNRVDASVVARLTDNLTRVRASIAAACARAGRSAEEVHLVAVTKYVEPPVIQALLAAGCRDLGESRVQQLVPRAAAIGADLSIPGDESGCAFGVIGRPRWHMIGHLQRNKVRQLLPQARILHSLDSERLATELSEQAARTVGQVGAFIEVNVSGEESKDGVAPDMVEPLLDHVRSLPHLRVLGLMTMAPLSGEPSQARPHFARLRGLLERLRDSRIAPPECRHLSMGMSHDFEIAIEEGATWVRVGSALFEGIAND